MTEHRTSVSKRMSHALRHAPEKYGLVLDDQGWVDISALIESIRQTWPQDGRISESMIVDIVRTSSKSRFEIRDGLVRARYGHSLADSRIVNEEIVPSLVLFHATDPVKGWSEDQLAAFHKKIDQLNAGDPVKTRVAMAARLVNVRRLYLRAGHSIERNFDIDHIKDL